MTRRLVLTVAILAWLVSMSSPASAKGSIGHRSTKSSSGQSSGSKTVHVRTYTKKHGPRVAAHPQRRTGSRPLKTPSTRGRSSPSSGVKARSSNARIARSEAAKHAFEVQSGYPHSRPGYVVDHIKPLACGGADVPSNMQWQTIAAAKAKDRVERIGCH